MGRKYFGTDGIRGKVGQFPVTPEFAMRLGHAMATVLRDQGEGIILVGKDTRISGYMFESALEAGISAAGMTVRLLGPMPTPAVAYLTRTLRARAGIAITASHNPYTDNGFKFFSAAGEKFSEAWELAVEEKLDAPMELVPSAELGKARRVVDASGRYIEFCKSSVPNNFSLQEMRIALDCANGAAYATAPLVFRELGAEVVVIGDQPDGLNINEGVGSTCLEPLIHVVQVENADLGVALDGDGDRCLIVKPDGEVIDGDQLLYTMSVFRAERGLLAGPVVGTSMTNLGVEHALQRKGIELVRAAVGDRYVFEMLHKTGGIVGGESSGHLICRDCTTTGDGIVSALQVLHAMGETGKLISELLEDVQLYPQVLINVAVKDQKIGENDVVQVAVQKAEQKLGEKGRVLLRPSGTEPLIRVMVEGEDASLVQQLAEELSQVVKQAAD